MLAMGFKNLLRVFYRSTKDPLRSNILERGLKTLNFVDIGVAKLIVCVWKSPIKLNLIIIINNSEVND